ncbi:secreted RxLR effector protein 161-like [Pistacia vera]|uniref:secreted RxLR effector protein 161-like n=1 Tax=Pistacia vera TaxID=55513 RepID=UPI001263CEC0|nr:secreted RxLR effector protein 161-like [Pistacia vera]
MADYKPVKIPMTLEVKLSTNQYPKSKEDVEEMTYVTYASAMGSLMFVVVCTKPDIAQAVEVLSRFMSNLGKEHWSAVKRVLRYLCGTSGLALCYGGMATRDELDVIGFVDADWGGDLDSRRSTSGYLFTLFGASICWMSKRQSTVALSLTEAEYMALTYAGKLCGFED